MQSSYSQSHLFATFLFTAVISSILGYVTYASLKKPYDYDAAKLEKRRILFKIAAISSIVARLVWFALNIFYPNYKILTIVPILVTVGGIAYVLKDLPYSSRGKYSMLALSISSIVSGMESTIFSR